MANPENLKPFVKGDPRINRKGRKPGVKNWSTVVQDLLADEHLIDKVVTTKPDYWDDLPTKNAANAIVTAMIIQALKGEKTAAEWLRKAGFGDKVDLTSAGERMTTTPVIVSQIVPRKVENNDDEAETETTDDN